jgi:ferredoxin--NADP+ reductase
MSRIAVVGAGPSGVYCAAALLALKDLSVDVFDRLPSPFGLVRYGVAPDHPKIKSVSTALERVLTDDRVRFLGNVQVGRDLTVDEMHGYYDSVIFAVGAADEGRRLDIPGEELAGSASGVDFVRWYSGYPDALADGFHLSARRVVVVGAGNVALDVARILGKSADQLRGTDVPLDVLAEFERSTVTDVHVLVRRGPASTRFTTVELRELGRLEQAEVRVDPRDIEPDPPGAGSVALRNLRVFREWSQREPRALPRTIHFHFWTQPTLIGGDGAVREVVVERTDLSDRGDVVGTGARARIPAEMVLSCIGYRGTPVPGVPFDELDGVIPNAAGRVIDDDGRTVPGEYVAGWIKRGPTGVIGTNKHDANETVAALLEDLAAREGRPPGPEKDVLDLLLRERGVHVVRWDGWTRLRDAEARLGQSLGRGTVKITDRDELLAAAAGDAGVGSDESPEES